MEEAGTTAPVGDAVAWPDVTGQAIADHFGFTPQWLRKLELQGFVERKENGLFHLGDATLGIIAFYKSPERRAAKNAPSSRMLDAQIKRLELTSAGALARLADTDIAELCARRIVAVLGDIFLGLAPLPNPAVDAQARQLIAGAFKRTEKGIDAFFAGLRLRMADLPSELVDEPVTDL